MKAFRLVWTNSRNGVFPLPLPPYRIIGIQYDKQIIVDRLAEHHIITIWLWKWFRTIEWLKEINPKEFYVNPQNTGQTKKKL